MSFPVRIARPFRRKVLYALLSVLAIGLISAGCGGDDDNGDTTPAAEEAEATAPTGATGEAGAAEEGGATVEIAEGASPGSVYQQCKKALEGLDYGDFPCQQVQHNYDRCEGAGCAEMAAGTIENLVAAGEPAG